MAWLIDHENMLIDWHRANVVDTHRSIGPLPPVLTEKEFTGFFCIVTWNTNMVSSASIFREQN